MTLAFVHDTSPLKVEAMRLFLTLKNLKYLVGERERMETVLDLQFSGTQHIKCCEFLCTTACGFPEVGMLLCLLYFGMSLQPPLWPNTTTVHCWCKVCPDDHSKLSLPAFFHCHLKSTIPPLNICHHLCSFPISSFFPVPPSFTDLKSDHELAFKTWVGKGAWGGRTSVWSCWCPLMGLWHITPCGWSLLVLGGSSGLSFLCAFLKACILHLVYSCYPGVVINCLATAPSHGHTSLYHFPFLSFRRYTIWSKSPYPQHCQQREVNTSVGSHGPVNLNKEHRKNISGGLPELPYLNRKRKKGLLLEARRRE